MSVRQLAGHGSHLEADITTSRNAPEKTKSAIVISDRLAEADFSQLRTKAEENRKSCTEQAMN